MKGPPPGLIARWALLTLLALLVFLPLEQLGLPLLFAIGIPRAGVRAISGFKEVALVGLAAASVVEMVRRRQKPDHLDIAIIAYVAVVSFELLFPHVLSPHNHNSLEDRVLAWLDDCGYAIILFAVRHLRLPGRPERSFVVTVSAMGAVLVGIGVFQRIDQSAFDHFVVHTAQLPQYFASVLHEPAYVTFLAIQQLQNTPLRVTSLLLYPFDLGDYMLILVAVLTERISRNPQPWWVWSLLAGAGATIFLTEVRGDFFAAVLILLAGLLPLGARSRERRRKLGLALAAGVLVAVPFLGTSRYLGGDGASASNLVHANELGHSFSVIVGSPLGLGLGDQPGTAERFGTEGANSTVGDNSVLQVQVELGFEGLVPWLAMMAFLLVELFRRRDGPCSLALGTGMATVGLLIAGQSHPAFVDYSVPWTLMAAAGLALSRTRHSSITPTASHDSDRAS